MAGWPQDQTQSFGLKGTAPFMNPNTPPLLICVSEIWGVLMQNLIAEMKFLTSYKHNAKSLTSIRGSGSWVSHKWVFTCPPSRPREPCASGSFGCGLAREIRYPHTTLLHHARPPDTAFTRAGLG